MSKRERPPNFFEDDEDEDYLIAESIDMEKEKEVMGFEEYMDKVDSAVKQTSAPLDYLAGPDHYDYNDMPDFGDMDDLIAEAEEYAEKPFFVEAPSSFVENFDTMDIEDEEDEQIIDLSERTTRKTTSISIKKKTKVHLAPTPPAVKKVIDYTLIPETGAFVTATCPTTGLNVYFSKKSVGESRNKKDAMFKELTSKGTSRGLLSKPLWQLNREIEKENAEKLALIEKEIEEAKSRKNKKQKSSRSESTQLWADKYKPTTYMELMGDQRLNRDVLRWVKQWDYCVFKKKPSAETQRDKVMRQYRSTFGKDPNFAAYKQNNTVNTDPYLRPEKKILLMSGPPGFGKTTLAHVIAKQAGYNVIEINASDDRTGAIVNTKVKAALEQQAIIRENAGDKSMAMSQKPNLIIIDEIDGASMGGGADSFIKQLVKLTEAETEGKKKGKGKDKPLLRPIICICNDVYAPVLRPLRMVAQPVVFKKVPMMSIAKRLQDICDMEGLDSDLRTLSMLSETTDGDIRSCLNTLQFVRGKSTTFTRDMLDKAGVGSKDMGKSLFSVWEELFCAPNARHKKARNEDDFDNNKYLGRLTNSVMSNGEIDRIMQGCFESYPLMRFHDVAFQKFCQISEWLEFYDILDDRANFKHEYELYKYLPYPVVNFHRFFAGSTSQEHTVSYPRVEYETFATKKSYENLIAVFLAGIHSSKRRYLNKDMVANEIVPLLMHIISPELKPTNQQLIKPAEKAKLVRLIDIMIEFGLSFVQEKNEDGQFIFKLDPPVEQLLSFNLSTPKNVLPRQYAVRQMISHEIETEILRRREEASQLRNGPDKSNKDKQTTESVASLKVQKRDLEQKIVSVDFFGRALAPRPKTESVKSAKMEVDTPKAHVNYRYHEGFSNAVRKPMTVQMFL